MKETCPCQNQSELEPTYKTLVKGKTSRSHSSLAVLQDQRGATAKSRTSHTPSLDSAVVCQTPRLESMMLGRRRLQWIHSLTASIWSGKPLLYRPSNLAKLLDAFSHLQEKNPYPKLRPKLRRKSCHARRLQSSPLYYCSYYNCYPLQSRMYGAFGQLLGP